MRILAEHSIDKKERSNIITMAGVAKAAKAKNPEVINATIGMLFDEDEKFYTFRSVKAADSELTNEQKYPYTNTIGIKPYCDAVLNWVFDKHLAYFKEHEYLSIITTPGGSGAISNAFSNYLNAGENVLLPNYMWTNYIQVAYENYLGYETYNMFNEEGTFDLADLKETFLKMQAKQKRILFVINDPCQNPTGYSLTNDEWLGLINIINEVATKDHPFILFYDMAYIDYDKNGRDYSRTNIGNFKLLNENVLTILAFSGSKTLGLYGLRIGAMIGLNKKPETIEDFTNACQFSARTKYSMATTYGMYLIAKVLGEEKYLASFKEELGEVTNFIKKRSNAFIKAAEAVGLKTLPFKCGFFVTVACPNDDLVYDYLVAHGAHVIPLGGAIRIAICSISEANCAKLPKLIKEAIDAVNKR